MARAVRQSDTKRNHEEVTHIQVPQDDDEFSDLPPPPDGGYGWVIVAASFMCNMVVDGISYTFGIFLPEIVRDYGETKGNVAWVGSILTGMTMCAGPVVSALANKFGCRTVCIAGSLISTVAFTLSIFSPNVSWLMLLYGFIGGIGFGLIYLPAVVCVGYYFESKRSLATGIAVCGSGVGTFAFAPLATILLRTYGWKGANLILAGIILNCVIFGALMRPLEYPKKSKLSSNLARNTSIITLENSKISQKPIKYSSHGTLAVPTSNTRTRNDSIGSVKHRNTLEIENVTYTSKLSLTGRKEHVIQPLARKDIFYSGSILNLKEFQSQKSLASYRHSVTHINTMRSVKNVQQSENSYMGLLKDPVFMLIGISSLFAMAGLYVPFVYLVDCATEDGIDANSASFLLSIIGITNTVARIVCGYFADFPQINALLVNNICLLMAAISVGFIPFCHTYIAYTTVSVVFATGVAGYISLSSIILVDLLGLDKLTNAFGLLILFRGAAALVGSPLAGGLYDATKSYDVPFFVAGALFAISAGISFMVPCIKICSSSTERSVDDETLQPINDSLKHETSNKTKLINKSRIRIKESLKNMTPAEQTEKLNETENVINLPPPPDGGYGWIIVLASFVCNMVVDGIAYTFGIFLFEIVQYYNETKGKTAWVGSLLTGTYLTVGPLVGALCNKYGCRPVCITGSIISTIAFALSIFSPTVNWLIFTYGFLGGFGFGLIYLPAVVCVGYYFESKRSLATGIALCGSGVGTFLFAPLATILLDRYSWKGATLILSGIIFNCAIFGALMRPLQYTKKDKQIKCAILNRKKSTELTANFKETRHGNEHNFRKQSLTEADSESLVFTSKSSLAGKKDSNYIVQHITRKDIYYSGSIQHLAIFQSQKSLEGYRQSVWDIAYVEPHRNIWDNCKKNIEQICDISLLKDPVFTLIGISNFFAMAALYVPFIYLVDYAKSNDIKAENASFLLSVMGITNTIGRIVCGYITDLPQVNALLVNNVCLVIATLSVGAIPLCQTYSAYVVAAVCFAIAVAGFISLSSIILVDLLGLDRLTSAFGLLTFFRGAAALIGTPLAGSLYDTTQTYQLPFYVAGSLFATAAVISSIIPLLKRKNEDKNEVSTATNMETKQNDTML
ncbi:hypothetical protein NQ315_015248 [Exocentrus adspersus]|uniref:Major facilitator superfamily (MFS) profile domain-containing protein n=1 Tax=Exocentrus adspersus TaxID=1586481 RepID=A0AAV8VAL7_9CUCU|nr:hypothetical protein NQ315_015248 [Exocentrus adspersus]